MQLSECGIQFIAEFESFFPFVYDDARSPTREYTGGTVSGVLTIGYGTTDREIVSAYIGKRCTEEQARWWFLHEIATRYQPALDSLEGRLAVRFNQPQSDTILSFDYNAGEGILFDRSSTPRRVLESDDWSKFPDAIALYNKGSVNGHLVVMPGLSRRRAREGAMWRGDYGFPCSPTTRPHRRLEDRDD